MSKGTRLATASFAAAHESVDDDDSWRLSATQDPSRESRRRRRRADDDDDAREGAAIGASRRGAGVFCSAAAAAALPPGRAAHQCPGAPLVLGLWLSPGPGSGRRRDKIGAWKRRDDGDGPQRGRRERERPGGPQGGDSLARSETMRPRRPFALLDFPCSRSRMYRPASEASALCLPACGVCVYKYYHVAVSCSWVKLLA